MFAKVLDKPLPMNFFSTTNFLGVIHLWRSQKKTKSVIYLSNRIRKHGTNFKTAPLPFGVDVINAWSPRKKTLVLNLQNITKNWSKDLTLKILFTGDWSL